MQGVIGIYHPPAGAPFHIGAIVKVVAGDETVDKFVGEIGTIDHYDYYSGVGQTAPDNPLLVVRFFGGQRQSFWPEELIELVPKGAAAPDLLAACEKLVDYRRRVGPLNFQLEKADDYIQAIAAATSEAS